MTNFYDLISDVLQERNKSIKDLENDGVLTKNTFYNFKDTAPSLSNIIAIANYLSVSIDYIIGNTSENKFKRYSPTQPNLYSKISALLNSSGISQSKLCKAVGISRTNFSRWNHGATPKLSTLIEICKYLSCNLDDILEKK
ncbi:MAG: helix-turn-helix transcriptional regulator [Clostridia bacterium]|nr:helix-turn-helix transcriptional regulator [Clostridia bacterium]